MNKKKNQKCKIKFSEISTLLKHIGKHRIYCSMKKKRKICKSYQFPGFHNNFKIIIYFNLL